MTLRVFSVSMMMFASLTSVWGQQRMGIAPVDKTINPKDSSALNSRCLDEYARAPLTRDFYTKVLSDNPTDITIKIGDGEAVSMEQAVREGKVRITGVSSGDGPTADISHVIFNNLTDQTIRVEVRRFTPIGKPEHEPLGYDVSPLQGMGQNELWKEQKRMAEARDALVRPKAEAENKVIPGKEITNSIGMRLRLIPAGKFMMGSPSNELGRQSDETRHEVIISRDFYMGATEVTQAQYKAVMGTVSPRSRGPNFPADEVSWDEAMELCRRLSESEKEKEAGLMYRLPTEAEWEYACRAGRDTPRFWQWNRQMPGDVLIGDYVWYIGNSSGKTHEVGQTRPNRWGLYDMIGNVREWCMDRYGDYPNESVTNPNGYSTGSNRVNRGDQYTLDPRSSRSALRDKYPQSWSSSGFRIVAIARGSRSPQPVSNPDAPQEMTNSIGMRMKLIPAGKFMMGSPSNEQGRQSDETLHEVNLTRSYYMGVTEVTQAQYQTVMGKNSLSDETNLPVEDVSWNEAVEFCMRLTESETEENSGLTYRLPTEAEWEYACRAGTDTAFFWLSNNETSGKDLMGRDARHNWLSKRKNPGKDGINDYVWFFVNSGGKAHEVGQKKPNSWGLYDMIGNAREWCADWYGEYPGGAVTNPTGPSTGSERVNRGGQYYINPKQARSACREKYPPEWRSGYRVVAEMQEPRFSSSVMESDYASSSSSHAPEENGVSSHPESSPDVAVLFLRQWRLTGMSKKEAYLEDIQTKTTLVLKLQDGPTPLRVGAVTVSIRLEAIQPEESKVQILCGDKPVTLEIKE